MRTYLTEIKNIVAASLRVLAKLLMCVALPIALVCNSIVFSSDVLPALAFFHFNPGLAFGLYLLVLMSWFVMYFSSGLPLLLDWLGVQYKKDNKETAKTNPTMPLFKAIGLANVLLNGFTLMGGIAVFIQFCQQYGVFSAAFLSSNLFLISAVFFVSGLSSSYALTYQRIKAVGAGISENVEAFGNNPLRITFAFIIAVLAGVSSAIFALYCTPIVALFHMVVPWQIFVARAAVTVLAFVAAFSLYFVSLNKQLIEIEGFNESKITPGGVLFAIISIVAATAFCFTSYHQFAVLFTITNANRGFVIAEVCCQWIAFSTAYFYAYSGLTETIDGFANNNPNIMFIAEHLMVTILASYSIHAFLMPAIMPLMAYSAAVLTGTLLFGLVMIMDHYLERNIIAKESGGKAYKVGTLMAASVFGTENCEVIFKAIDGLVESASSYKNFFQSKVM